MRRPRCTVPASSSSFAVALACGLAACGGPTVAPPVGPSVAVAPSSKPVLATPVAEDRSPVDAPEGLVARAHFASPRRLAHAIKSSTGTTVEPRTILADLIDAPALAELVDLDAPVDAAVLVERKPGKDDVLGAWALGLDEAADLARLGDSFKLVPMNGGVLRVAAARAAKWDDPQLGNYRGECWIAPALGPARRRLVCPFDPDPKSNARLAPWLTRGVTRRDPTDALARLDVDVRPLRAAFADELARAHDELSGEVPRWLSVGRKELDKVLVRLAKQLVDESFDLLDDVDGVSLSLGQVPDAVRVSGAVTFGRSTSWSARAALALSEGSGGAPAHLLAIPADGVGHATFTHVGPSSDALVQPWQAAMLQLTEATAIDFAWAPKDKDAALELVRAAFPRMADGVAIGGGADDGSVAKVADDFASRKLRRLVERLTRPGWTISAIEREAKSTRELCRAAAAVLGSASFAKTVKSLTDDEVRVAVKSATTTPKGLGKDASAQTLDLVVSVIEHVVVAEATQVADGKPAKTAKAAPKKNMVVAFKLASEALVVPSGARTWTAWGRNVPEAELVERLQRAMSGKGTLTLGQLPGFDFLGAASASSGGWMSTGWLLRAADAKDAPPTASTTDGVVWRTSATKEGAGGTAQIELSLRNDAIAAGKTLGKLLDRVF